MSVVDDWTDEHRGHGTIGALPFVAEGGWDARRLECYGCGATHVQVRAIPAEDTLIDPDPHLRTEVSA